MKDLTMHINHEKHTGTAGRRTISKATTDHSAYWGLVAKHHVAHSSTRWFSDHRGMATIYGDDSCCLVYGNDGFSKDIRSRIEVGVLRKYLQAIEIGELGFAVNDSGYSWLMVVGAEARDEFLQVVRAAWMQAAGLRGQEVRADAIEREVERIASELGL